MTGCLVANPKYAVTGDASDGRDDAGESGGVTTENGPTVATTAMTTDDTSGTSAGNDSNGDATSTSGVGSSEVTGVGDTGPSSAPCSAFDSDSCPEGEGCKPLPTASDVEMTVCIPLAPTPAQVWEPCTLEPGVPGMDGCDAGLACYPAESRDLGICTPLCEGSPDEPICTQPGTLCGVFPGADFGLCLPGCNPFGNDCSAGEECRLTQNTLACFPDRSGQMQGQTAACQLVTECDPGLTCIAGDLLVDCATEACCTEFCDVQVDLCPAGLSCVEVWPPGGSPPPPSLTSVGICVNG